MCNKGPNQDGKNVKFSSCANSPSCLILDLPWIDVLTDILLSLLSQPSQLMRTVVERVFTAVITHVTPRSLTLITQVKIIHFIRKY